MPKRHNFFDDFVEEEEDVVKEAVLPAVPVVKKVANKPVDAQVIIKNIEYKNPWKSLESAKVNLLDIMKEQERENLPPEARDIQPRKYNILCLFEKDHNPTCRYSHSLQEWEPRHCKFDAACKNIKTCHFIHRSVESNDVFLGRMFLLPNNPYSKNEQKFKKLYQ